jgi:hypothetical protein
MVDYQTISVVIAAYSVVFAMITWFAQSRENSRINQAKLFMQIHDQWNEYEFKKLQNKIRYKWSGPTSRANLTGTDLIRTPSFIPS